MMQYNSRLIERYLIKAILPYLLLALLLLTMILLLQQAGRFAELLLGAQAPATLLADITISLLPSVLVLTLPMATLAGTVIGLSRLIGDSELVVMRAAGVSDRKILSAVLSVGLLLTLFALYLNARAAPDGARALHLAGLQAALNKMDSPVEPKTFNTDIPGYVLYVRDGDNAKGRWENVFIYSHLEGGATRLITAKSGRLDYSGEQTELVLNDAVATTLPDETGTHAGQYVAERLATLRLALDTGRKTLIERLKAGGARTVDEMYPGELLERSKTVGQTERSEAAILFHRRLMLALSPLVFAFLGTVVSLRFRFVGRGWGSLATLSILIIYYMLWLLGEQLSRKGTVPPVVGAWMATVISIICALVLLKSDQARRSLVYKLSRRNVLRKPVAHSVTAKKGIRFLGFPSLLDISVFRDLTKSLVLAYLSLVTMFMIFTLFELWRFVLLTKPYMLLITKYMFFLMPLVTVQVLPASALIACLATYALMARRSEAVAWWASGQSVYRLVLPGLLYAVLISLTIWLVQEYLMPQANLRQDTLRAQIRGRSITPSATAQGRLWLASGTEPRRIYAYEFNEPRGELVNPAIYEFDSGGVHLGRLVRGERASFGTEESQPLKVENAELILFQDGRVRADRYQSLGLNVSDDAGLFKSLLNQPSYLSARQLSKYIVAVRPIGRDMTPFVIALQRKYTEPLTALVLVSFGIPLALSFGRRGAVLALSAAVGAGLSFWGVARLFQQLGEYGLLPPSVAVWSPIIIYLIVGFYLLTRTRT